MDNIVLGIDIAKSVFHVCKMDKRGKVITRRKLSRIKVAEFVAQTPPCVVAMESCAGAHYWARRFISFGHQVRLIAPQFVKPYVKTNKNDSADAEAVCEAALRPTMRFVHVKSVAQQDLQALHRVRERLVAQRTALSNEIRGLLGEYGIVVPQGLRRLIEFLAKGLEHEASLSPLARQTFCALQDELTHLLGLVSQHEKKILAIAKKHPVCRRLMTAHGVGPLIATAAVASVSDPLSFKNGRQFAAFLGLVPRQHSTGGKQKLLGISKRGDVYLRRLLVHGARAVVKYADRGTDNVSLWIQQLKQRKHINKVVVALANKNARILWALMARDDVYREVYAR